MDSKILTLNLSSQEMDLLERMCEKKQMSKTALMRQCLRIYNAIEQRLAAGEKLFFENKEKEKSEIIVL